jgi:hypothetical protein
VNSLIDRRMDSTFSIEMPLSNRTAGNLILVAGNSFF